MPGEDSKPPPPSGKQKRPTPRLLRFARLAGWAIVVILPFLAYRLALVTHSIAVQSQRNDFPPTTTASLSRVIDADTIEVFVRGRRERVQLLGVDGPELFRKEKAQVGGRLESQWVPVDDPEARAAQAELARFLEGKSLTLEFDPVESQTDRYGRLLAWVWIEERSGARILVNEWVIGQGLAELRPGRSPLKYDPILEAAAEERARATP